jgi:hypothetical protein
MVPQSHSAHNAMMLPDCNSNAIQYLHKLNEKAREEVVLSQTERAQVKLHKSLSMSLSTKGQDFYKQALDSWSGIA